MARKRSKVGPRQYEKGSPFVDGLLKNVKKPPKSKVRVSWGRCLGVHKRSVTDKMRNRVVFEILREIVKERRGELSFGGEESEQAIREQIMTKQIVRGGGGFNLIDSILFDFGKDITALIARRKLSAEEDFRDIQLRANNYIEIGKLRLGLKRIFSEMLMRHFGK